MVCRVSAAMIGATSMVCAMIIARGVNSRPNDPERSRPRQREIDRKPDDDRRQAHQRVEQDDDALAAGKSRQRDPGAERHADQRGEQHRRQADDQRQPHDGEQRGIAAEHELQARIRRPASDIPFRRHLAQMLPIWSIFVANAFICILVRMPELLTTDEAADYLRLSRAQALRAGGGARGSLQQGDRALAVSARRARSLGFRRPDRTRRRWRRWPRRRSSAAVTIRCWNGRCAKAIRDWRACRRDPRRACGG